MWFRALMSARPHYGEVWVPKYDKISYWCSITTFKSLIGALQLTSISIFAASTCSNRCGFEPWYQHHCTRGRRVTPAAHAILSQPAPLFVLLYRISIIYYFVQIKPISMMFFHRVFQFFFTKQGIADTIPNLLSGFGLILWGLSKAKINAL